MEFFHDIKENKEEGASSLLILALRKIEKFISDQDKISPSDIFVLTSELKRVRPSMVIMRNYAEKIEKFLANFRETENIKSQIQDFIYQLIEEIREKRKKIVNQGIDIIRRYKKIAVVSYSSILKEILDNFSDKKILALYYDKYAERLAGKNEILFVREDEIGNIADVGIMGADAVVISNEGKFIINGFPSSKFCDALHKKPIFVFAEKEKITDCDVEIEEGFEKVKFGENMKLISD